MKLEVLASDDEFDYDAVPELEVPFEVKEDEEFRSSSLINKPPTPRYTRGGKPPLKWTGTLTDSISNGTNISTNSANFLMLDYYLSWAQLWHIFYRDYQRWKHIDVARIVAKCQVPPHARRKGCYKSTLIDCANQFCELGKTTSPSYF